MKSKLWFLLGGALALLLALFVLLPPAQHVSSAPLAAPTAVTAAAIHGIQQPVVVTFAEAESITADTRLGCADTRLVNLLDINYVINQGTVNTVTLTLQHTNDDPTSASAAFADGLDAVAANAADVTAMQQLQAFGAWTCIYADVANTNTLVLTVDALLK